jgi:hypothetical protein
VGNHDYVVPERMIFSTMPRTTLAVLGSKVGGDFVEEEAGGID